MINLFNIAYLLYSACCSLYLTYLVTKREQFSQWAHTLLLTAFTLHVVSLISLTATNHMAPWASRFGTLSFFGAIIAFIYMVISYKNHIPILGAFIMPLAWGLLSGAVASNRTIRPLQPELQSYWMGLHVPIIFTAYAFLGVAFAVGIAYLLQERQMKSKRPSELTYRLPPLEDLDRLISQLIIAAFPPLTLGIFMGGIWAHQAWGRFWDWDPKETWALITWLVYVAYLFMRFVRGWRGRKTAYLSLAGFVVVLFTYVGVNKMSPRHDFMSKPQTELP
jgi:cytochrome c-type biogenesis protein CcsB